MKNLAVLIDANVILDYVLQRFPEFEYADKSKVIVELEEI